MKFQRNIFGKTPPCRVQLKEVLKDMPKFKEKFRLFLNEEYMKAIKDIPEIEQIMTLDDNNHLRLDRIETNEEKTTEINSPDNSTEQLPEGAEWKLNSNGKYILKVTNDDGSRTTYSAEVASKKFGLKIPESQLPEGAQWKLNSSGKYMLVINEDGAKKSYSAEVASKKFGITPPIIKNPQLKSELPIAKDTKKSVENIARTGLSRDVQRTSSEIKEGYKELENPTQTLEDNKSKDE